MKTFKEELIKVQTKLMEEPMDGSLVSLEKEKVEIFWC